MLRHLNSTSAWYAVSILLRVGSGILLLPLILRYVPAEQLGLWYTFMSLGAASTMLDIGIAKAASRNVAAMVAGASGISRNGFSAADEDGAPNWAGVASLLGAMRLTYLAMVGVVAAYFLVAHFVLIPWPGGPGNAWDTPHVAWYLYAAGQLLIAYSRWQVPVLSGLGHIKLTQRVASFGTFANLALAATLLIQGGGLIGVAAAQFAQVALTRVALSRVMHTEFPHLQVATDRREAWRILSELWPATWRYGSMVLAGNTLATVNMLYVGHRAGLEAAAQFGLSLQLFTLLEQFAGILLAVRLPQLTGAYVRGDLAAAQAIVLPRLASGWLLHLAGCATIILAAPPVLSMLGSHTSLLPFSVLLLLAIERFLQFNQNQHVWIVIAANLTPALPGYLLTHVAIAACGWFAAGAAGVAGVLAANLLVQSLYNHPLRARLAARQVGLGVMRFHRDAILMLFKGWPNVSRK